MGFTSQQYAVMLVKLALAIIVWPLYILVCIGWLFVELWLWITRAK